MGYATYGHGDSGRTGGFYLAYAKGSKHSGPKSKQVRSLQGSRLKGEQSKAEDEIELRPTAVAGKHTADVRGGSKIKQQPRSLHDGIEVFTEYGYSTHTSSKSP